MKAFSQRLTALDPHYFASLQSKIEALQSQGRKVLRLDLGSPDLPPPPAVLGVHSAAVWLDDRHGYQNHRGPLALRQAWAEMYLRRHRVELDPDREILPLAGSKEGIFLLTQALVDAHDVVLVPDPGYLTYSRAALFAGAEVCWMPLRREEGYLPALEDIPRDLLRRAKLMWLNYPNNPTGATAPLEFFSRAVAFAHEHNLLLCHDAAYSQVTFDGYQAPSLLEVEGAKEVAAEFNSLSKSHNMAGWRVGVAVGNERALSALHALKTHVDSGQFLPILEAAAAALRGDEAWIRERNEIYRTRRDLVVATLLELGAHVLTPQASLYVWAPHPDGWTSLDFTTALLEQTGVSVAPGIVFGSRGEGFVRISLAAPTDHIAEAMDRLASWWPRSDPRHLSRRGGGTA